MLSLDLRTDTCQQQCHTFFCSASVMSRCLAMHNADVGVSPQERDQLVGCNRKESSVSHTHRDLPLLKKEKKSYTFWNAAMPAFNFLDVTSAVGLAASFAYFHPIYNCFLITTRISSPQYDDALQPHGHITAFASLPLLPC